MLPLENLRFTFSGNASEVIWAKIMLLYTHVNVTAQNFVGASAPTAAMVATPIAINKTDLVQQVLFLKTVGW